MEVEESNGIEKDGNGIRLYPDMVTERKGVERVIKKRVAKGGNRAAPRKKIRAQQ